MRTAGNESRDRWEGQGTILVVDDEEGVRDVAERMLERLGFDVVTAEDGSQGLDLVRQDPQRFVCVVLDLTMPCMDGAECFDELMRLRPELPVLVSSGYSEDVVAERLGGGRPAGFVGKPFDLERLSEALRAVLS